MSLRIGISKTVLQNLYISRGFSSGQIAKRYRCEKTAILNRLREYYIPLRHPKSPLNPNRKVLHDLYIDQNLSPYKIAEQLNCNPSTIRNWLKTYEFPIRKKKLITVSKARLSYLYYDKKMSLSGIGHRLGYTPSGIFGAFKKLRLPLRTTSQSSKYHFFRSNFDGSKPLKAYLIGFRIGDLYVKKEGHLIKIGSGTTKKDQLMLFNELFKKFGKIYLGPKDKRGAWHPGVSLNQSFRFLLPKHDRIPIWILNSRKYFFSFLAGYTDAEGNIGCYPRARFKLASYDYGILKDIGAGIEKYLTIKPIYFLEKTNRKTHRKDSLSLIINNMYSLYTFLTDLIPILRHKKRRRDAEKTLKSIKHRPNFHVF